MPKPTDAALAAALRPLADALITPESIRREKEHDSTHREDGQLRAEKVEGRLRNNRTGIIDSSSVQVPATSAGPAGSLKRHLERIADTIRAGACDLLVDELGAVILDEFGDPILVGDCGDDTGAYALGRVNTHMASTSNPHGVTKAQVGLGNADNTADTAKPVSTAQQAALDLKAPLASPTFTGTVSGITPAMIGLDPDTTTLSLPAGTTISAFGASLVDDASAAAVLTTLGITAAVAELNYTAGVTSAIQTQLDAKQPLDADLTTIAGLTATTDNVIQSVAGAWASRTMAQFKTALALTLADIVAALGYTPVNKAGDTMTGDLSLQKSTGIPTIAASSKQGAGFTPPTMGFERVGVAGAATPDNQQLGRFVFNARNTLGNVVAPAILSVTGGINTSVGIPATFAFATTTSGEISAVTRLTFTSNGGVTVNPTGIDADFRVLGDTDANLLYTDASTDRVGIGTATPANKLDVAGTVQADGLRLDVTPTAETITPTHTITISINGVNYKLPVVAA